MPKTKYYIAIDLGAESGRVMLGSVTSEKLTLKEVHRFGNGPTTQNGSIHWDFGTLMGEIKAGLGKAIKESPDEPAGIAVDSWGVDYGLIGQDGKLLENPYHYRDSRTDDMLAKAFELMDKREIYDNTGIQFMQLNTIYQLLAGRLANPEAMGRAKKLIFIADLVAYHLCDEIFSEYSLASTSQLLDMRTGQWSKAIFEKLNLPLEIMPDIVSPGTIVGKLTDAIAKEFSCGRIPVIAAGSHDTACAVAAVPTQGGNWAYLSSGTWSLIGAEIPGAVINDATFEYQFTNEGGVRSTIRLLKNIMGLWLIQECRRYWQDGGVDLSYSQMAKMAKEATPFACTISPDYSEFLSPGKMPEKINRYLSETSQPEISDKGQMLRVILESLALTYRRVMDNLEEVTGMNVDVLHIVGGGIQNELLCQFTANAVGKKVIAGPIEATASGNIIMQAIATGQINSVTAGRELIRNSIDLKTYTPEDTQKWEEQYRKFK